MLWLEEVRLIISDYFDLLVNYDFCILMCVMCLKEDVLKEVVNLIQLFDLCFGQLIQIGEFEYVILDVLVCKYNGYWIVEFNSDSILCL